MTQHCDWCAKETFSGINTHGGNHLCIDCANVKRRNDAQAEKERYECSLTGRLVAAVERALAWIDDCGAACLAIALLVGAGAGLHAGFDAIQAARVSYTVRVAGDNAVEDLRYHKLIDAEYNAHVLVGNPETEQEAGRAVLILDQDGRLVDTVTR